MKKNFQNDSCATSLWGFLGIVGLPFTVWALFKRVQWRSDGRSGLVDNSKLVLLRSMVYYTTSYRWPSTLAVCPQSAISFGRDLRGSMHINERNVNVRTRYIYLRIHIIITVRNVGNVFTRVCQSIHRGGVWQTPPVCRHPPWQTPSSDRSLQQTVRILLECILILLFKKNNKNDRNEM